MDGNAWNATTHKIKKELSICQSLLCLDLVSFPVLSQIKPQAPILSGYHITKVCALSTGLNLRCQQTNFLEFLNFTLARQQLIGGGEWRRNWGHDCFCK